MASSDHDSDTIIVENIPEDITIDKLIIHFQKKKNFGGDISMAKFIGQVANGRRGALIKFDNHADIAKVYQTQHILNNVQLKVELWKPEIWTKCSVIIQNEFLCHLARYHKITFDSCILSLSKAWNLLFSVEPHSDAWKVVGKWNDLKKLEAEIIKVLQTPHNTGEDADKLCIQESYWNMLYSQYPTEILQIVFKTLFKIEKTAHNLLNISINHNNDSDLKIDLNNFFDKNACKFFDNASGEKSSKQIDNSYHYDHSNSIANVSAKLFDQNMQIKNEKITALIKGDFSFLNSVHVFICQGDITKERVDVIVNASNRELNHRGTGVARAISTASKDGSVQKFCDNYVKKYGKVSVGNFVISAAGKLLCSKIYHAVGPDWESYGENSKNILDDLFFKLFKSADDAKLSSMALPLISSGNFGVPRHVVATCLFFALHKFSKRSAKVLKDIRLIDVNLDTINIVLEVFKNMKFPNQSHQEKKLLNERSEQAKIEIPPRQNDDFQQKSISQDFLINSTSSQHSSFKGKSKNSDHYDNNHGSESYNINTETNKFNYKFDEIIAGESFSNLNQPMLNKDAKLFEDSEYQNISKEQKEDFLNDDSLSKKYSAKFRDADYNVWQKEGKMELPENNISEIQQRDRHNNREEAMDMDWQNENTNGIIFSSVHSGDNIFQESNSTFPSKNSKKSQSFSKITDVHFLNTKEYGEKKNFISNNNSSDLNIHSLIEKQAETKLTYTDSHGGENSSEEKLLLTNSNKINRDINTYIMTLPIHDSIKIKTNHDEKQEASKSSISDLFISNSDREQKTDDVDNFAGFVEYNKEKMRHSYNHSSYVPSNVHGITDNVYTSNTELKKQPYRNDQKSFGLGSFQPDDPYNDKLTKNESDLPLVEIHNKKHTPV